MKSIEIKSNNRENTGKTSTNSLRKEGNVPCVLYGGDEVVHFSAKEIGFKAIFPDIKFCSDNAAMIAYAGYMRKKLALQAYSTNFARPRWPLGELYD